MADVKLTKNELRNQQNLLAQLEKYLPTLKLKKAMLQTEVNDARLEIVKLNEKLVSQRHAVERYSALLSEKIAIHPADAAKIKQVVKRYENIAGVEVPYYERTDFEDFPYSLFDTPPWVDTAIVDLRAVASAGVEIKVSEEKKKALEKELREVSIRVNLFEKILIPRAIENIKKIKVFLGDQQLAAVSQAKVAKNKIEERKLLMKENPHAV